MFKLLRKNKSKKDEFDCRFKFILDNKIDTRNNYNIVKSYYYQCLQKFLKDTF